MLHYWTAESTAGVKMIKPSELNKKIIALSARRKENFMELANVLQTLKDLSPSAFRATVAKLVLDTSSLLLLRDR